MLVVTTFGIFIPSLRPDSPAEGEPELQIRSRRAGDLDQLRDRYMGEALGPTIDGNGATDYQYRAYCTRQAWAEALYAIGLEIDYLSAKHAVEGDKALERANVRIWEVLLDLWPKGSRYDWRKRPVPPEPRGRGRRTRTAGYPWDRAAVRDEPTPLFSDVPTVPAGFTDEEWNAALAMDRPLY